MKRIALTIALVLTASCITAWIQHVQAQAPAQIGTNAPLPVYVTNPIVPVALPEGFVQGSQWRFTTWTVPSVITWTATVNKTSGGWANLTIVAEDRSTHTRWYYLPGMPGSWERQ
jgi:hypothetical protein